MALHKIINDPVHGFVSVNDEVILQLINHPYFQRLRRIKQMALANLVYPGAVHSRMQHSLGAYHLMCLSIDELVRKGFEITEEEQRGAKIAILLHDIGHGPFSHALESTLINVNHEYISQLMMQALNQEFNGALNMALDIFNGKTPKKFLTQLVSSQLDADRMDYLARDSFFTGVSEGIIGYDRLIKMLTVVNNELAVEAKGIHSVEKFIIARKLMYDQVYFHKTVLSSEQLLVKVLQRAKYLALNKKEIFATPTLTYFLQQNFTAADFEKDKTCLTMFAKLDDDDVMCAIKIWAENEDAILSDLSKRIINRNLFKTQFSYNKDEAIISKIIATTKQKLNVTLEEVNYYVIHDELLTNLYHHDFEPIIIAYKDGSLQEISTIKNGLIADLLKPPVKKYYICYPK